MARLHLRTAVFLLVVEAILRPAAPRAQAIQRAMYVSVLNEAGAPVPNLGPSDFIVREDSVVREVLRVAPADDRMQIAVLVDNSQAADNYIADIRRGLEAFVTEMMTPTEMGTRHELSIVALADRPTILADVTLDHAQAMKGVNRIFARSGSGNYLLEGVIEVCRGFMKRGAQRPVIVAITTEGPEFSSRYFNLVLDPLRRAGAALHALVLGPPSSDMSDDARNRWIVLNEGPRTTGGRRERLLTSMALPDKLKQLATELTHQYRVTYARPQSLIPPDRVSVSATRSGLTVRGTSIKEQRERP